MADNEKSMAVLGQSKRMNVDGMLTKSFLGIADTQWLCTMKYCCKRPTRTPATLCFFAPDIIHVIHGTKHVHSHNLSIPSSR